MKPVFNEFEVEGVKAINVYWYTEEIQSLMYQLKGCGDYELKDIFLDYYWEYVNTKFFGYTAIPAPSSEVAIKKRGFKQVEEIFSKLKTPLLPCIHKVNDIKQHNLSKISREEITKDLVIDDVDLSKKKILIIDDVYTTGSTIKSMINLVKSKGAKKIFVFVIAKTIDLDLR